MLIELNEPEQRLAQFVAKQRYLRNRAAGVPDGKVGPQGVEDTDLEGVGAELAFCKLFNVYPDLQTTQTLRSDATLRDGRGVDVKSTRREQGRLLAVTGKRGKETDLYALIVGLFPVYRFAGMVHASELFNADRLTNLGHGPTYAIDQSSLSVDDWLKDYG